MLVLLLWLMCAASVGLAVWEVVRPRGSLLDAFALGFTAVLWGSCALANQ